LKARVGFDSRLLEITIDQTVEQEKPLVFTYWGLFVAYGWRGLGLAILKICENLGVQ
jgi:hypothetical protein